MFFPRKRWAISSGRRAGSPPLPPRLRSGRATSVIDVQLYSRENNCTARLAVGPVIKPAASQLDSFPGVYREKTPVGAGQLWREAAHRMDWTRRDLDRWPETDQLSP